MISKTTRFMQGTQFARILVYSSFAIVVLAGLAFVPTVRAADQPTQELQRTALDAADGKEIFDAQCIGCHSIGGGKRVGPDLKDVTLRRDSEWIKSFVGNPTKMFKSDPAAQQLLQEYNNVRMPYLALKPEQVEAVLAYLVDPSVFPANPALVALPGDAVAGMTLFRGEQALTNGGPACIACHSVSGIGGLGGGALGPDLTHVFQRFGEPGLGGALKTIAFPTMQGPFAGRPLTEKEQIDLMAYLKQANGSQPAVAAILPGALTMDALLVFGIGLAGTLALLGALLLIWFRLKKGYSPNLPIRKA